MRVLVALVLFACTIGCNGQRITTIQLDGVQYFVSRMNPYSPELNYFLAYQYCRSLGLQLASFETREKADSITQYLSNAGYNKYDFWTSGNKLGTDMYLWMSTGLPFNATFNYMRKFNESSSDDPLADVPSGSTSPQRTARESDSGSTNGCVALKSPTFDWDTDDCMKIKDFICEQTRCYYYNYGSIPVSSAQGRPAYTTTSTHRPAVVAAASQRGIGLGLDDILAGMRTSSTSTSGGSGVLSYNDLVDELRSIGGGPASTTTTTTTSTPTSTPTTTSTTTTMAAIPTIMADDAEAEQTTNGPYDTFRAFGGMLELRDDPAAFATHHHQQRHHPQYRHDTAAAAATDVDYVSTIEPETVTIYERSLKSVH